MRFTRGADYGARGAIYLAKLPKDSIALVSEIASAERLPESYLAKIFQDLAKEGIVRSHRGAKGGFSLARPATEITLRDVIEAIEGPIALSRCLVTWEGCDKMDGCAIHPLLRSVQEQMVSALSSATLYDLAQADSLPRQSAAS